MNLCVDVGNSTIVMGFFEQKKLVNKLILTTNDKRTEDELYSFIKQQNMLHNFDINSVNKIIYSSVVPSLNRKFKNALSKLYKANILTIEPGIKTGLPIKVDNPLEIGNDLIADLVGAKDKYGYPLLICDLGTASKILVLDNTGTFICCVITPGLKMGSNSLTKNTALLPEISLEIPKTLIAKNTVDAMNAGLLFGHAEMINGLCRRYEKELGYSCKKVVTGGCSVGFDKLLDSDFIIDQDINLYGLNLILERNFDNAK